MFIQYQAFFFPPENGVFGWRTFRVRAKFGILLFWCLWLVCFCALIVVLLLLLFFWVWVWVCVFWWRIIGNLISLFFVFKLKSMRFLLFDEHWFGFEVCFLGIFDWIDYSVFLTSKGKNFFLIFFCWPIWRKLSLLWQTGKFVSKEIAKEKKKPLLLATLSRIC